MSRKVTYPATVIVTAYQCLRETRAAGGDNSRNLHICHGELQHDGQVRTVRGEQRDEYRHRCNACNQYEWLREKYPGVAYERIQEPAGG